MTTAEVLSVVAVVLGIALSIGLVHERSHVRALSSRVRNLERELRRLEPEVETARGDARRAAATAARAAAAAGAEEPLEPVPFEPVTGRVVRAVALGAGASRALVRLARPRRRSA